MEINATNLSQEKLISKAVMFCGDFGKVDKKTISKIVEDFRHRAFCEDLLFSSLGS